jgi:hypothetical protein
MDNIFNQVYRKDYISGYSSGLNPFLQISSYSQKSQAFISGFDSGRLEYESLNGSISDGIPNQIVTDKVLEEFLLAGMLGMNIDADGYTPYQINCIEKWYESGVEKYDPNESIYLLALLESNGIHTK